MKKVNIIRKFINDLLESQCKHQSINQFLSGSYCPDCGKRVVLSWIILKCKYCDAMLVPKVLKSGNIVPEKNYCVHCGHSEWFSQKLSNINFTESSFAVPLKEEIEENQPEQEETHSTDIWIEKTQSISPQKRKSNVIKANKYK